MTSETALFKMNLTPHKLLQQFRKQRWSWKTRGAVVGLCLGLLSPIAGSILTATAWITGAHWHGLFIQRYGTVLFLVTIPLLVFGAHCLDLIDKEHDDARHRRAKLGEDKESLKR